MWCGSVWCSEKSKQGETNEEQPGAGANKKRGGFGEGVLGIRRMLRIRFWGRDSNLVVTRFTSVSGAHLSFHFSLHHRIV
ncbi:hypothetical protein R1flu_019260 [Riccia fluitans]|uniref:Uncharacterized protein n=1 Tax=Riccia fluitans TaxID=41844 RepID=A0ABD1ZIH7_9MARC